MLQLTCLPLCKVDLGLQDSAGRGEQSGGLWHEGAVVHACGLMFCAGDLEQLSGPGATPHSLYLLSLLSHLKGVQPGPSALPVCTPMPWKRTYLLQWFKIQKARGEALIVRSYMKF